MNKMSLLAAAALMSTFLVACEGKKEKPAEETKAPESTQQVQKPIEEPKEVKEETPQVEEKVAKEEPVKEEKKVEETEVAQKVETPETTEGTQEISEETTEVPQAEAPQTEVPKQQVQKIDGRKLFSSKGCTVCHKEKLDTVGPALAKISAKYNGDRDSLIKFLRGKHPAIVDPARYTMMKPQIDITKKMSDAEINALVDYILSIK